MLRPALLPICLALALPAQALTLRDGTPVSGHSRADSGRADIFHSAGTLVPGWAEGFVGDAVGTRDGVYLGSVDEVYTRGHHSRVLVVGVDPRVQRHLGVHADFLYVTLPWSLHVSDGQVVLPLTAHEVARRF